MLVLCERVPYRFVGSGSHAVYVFNTFVVSANDAFCNIGYLTMFAHFIIVLFHQRAFFSLVLALEILGYPWHIVYWDSHLVEVPC